MTVDDSSPGAALHGAGPSTIIIIWQGLIYEQIAINVLRVISFSLSIYHSPVL
jgi:hypothetical protein